MDGASESLLKRTSSQEERFEMGACSCCRTHRQSFRMTLSLVALLVLNAAALFLDVFWARRDQLQGPRLGGVEYVPGGNTFVPEFPLRPTYLKHDRSYLEDTVDGIDIWEYILPAGAGYFPVPHPRQHGLPPSKPVDNATDGEEIYILSVAHQLHCLGAVRGKVLDYQAGVPYSDDHGHARHCLDKVREALMCSADTTTEVGYARRNDAGEIVGWDVDDIEVTHQCRDWDAIRAWMYDHRLNNKEGLQVI